MDFELTASMMCADYGNLKKEVRELEAGGIDSFILISWTEDMFPILPCR